MFIYIHVCRLCIIESENVLGHTIFGTMLLFNGEFDKLGLCVMTLRPD